MSAAFWRRIVFGVVIFALGIMQLERGMLVFGWAQLACSALMFWMAAATRPSEQVNE